MRRFVLPAALAFVLFAGVVRFVGLGAEPLDPAEASQSVAAWWTVKPPGEPLERLAPPAQSALLLGLDVAAFWLTDTASDASARWVAAASGVALVLLALVLVEPASAAAPVAFLLAVDPWLVAASRRADGAVLAVVTALACHLLLTRLETAATSAAVSAAARRRWLAWAGAFGLLSVSGEMAWDFLVPIAFAAVFAGRGSRRLGSPRPPVGAVLGASAAAALLASTTGLVQWRGPALVSSSLESWLASWSGSASGRSFASVAHASAAIVVYQVALVMLAVWGLWRGWSRRDDRARSTAPAPRDQAIALLAWLGWGAAMQLRSGSAWLALELPLLLAAALGLEDLWSRQRAGRAAAPRRAAAAFAALAIGAGLAGVEGVPRSTHSMPAARRLAADLSVLVERPAPERPRVEVASGPTVDGVLAWYLRDTPAAWVTAAGQPSGDEPRLVLVSSAAPRDKVPEPNGAPRYTIAAERDTVRFVELRSP